MHPSILDSSRGVVGVDCAPTSLSRHHRHHPTGVGENPYRLVEKPVLHRESSGSGSDSGRTPSSLRVWITRFLVDSRNNSTSKSKESRPRTPRPKSVRGPTTTPTPKSSMRLVTHTYGPSLSDSFCERTDTGSTGKADTVKHVAVLVFNSPTNPAPRGRESTG